MVSRIKIIAAAFCVGSITIGQAQVDSTSSVVIQNTNKDTLAIPPATEPTAIIVDEVYGVVANEIILKSDFEEMFLQYSRSQNTVDENTKCRLYEDLLYGKLLVDQAMRDSIVVTDGQINNEIDRRMDYFVQQIGSMEKLEQFYGKTQNQLREEFFDLIKDQMLQQQMEAQIQANISVTPKDVKEFFNSIPKDSIPYINAQMEVAHIVIDPEVSAKEEQETKAKLERIRERIVSGEDFGTLAYLYSEDPGSAAKNGDLGYVQKGMLVPEFAEVAFTLNVGELSQIVKSEFGYHLIEVMEIKGQERKVRHILMKPSITSSDLVEVKTELDSLKKQILEVDSISFEAMAMKYSDDKNTKYNGGKMVNQMTGANKFEMSEMSQMDPTLFYVLDKMKPGDISDPVSYTKPDGSKTYRIVYLIDITDPHVANLAQDYQLLYNVTTNFQRQEVMENWVKNKVANTYIKVDDQFSTCPFTTKYF